MREGPDEVEVIVEVPRGGHVKWTADRRVAYVSPLPSPFNYGSIPARIAEDGDPLDAVVLGPRLPRGHRGRWPVLGVVRFVDAGQQDDKVVCGRGAMTRRRRLGLLAFFHLYALGKGIAHRLRRRGGPTRCLGFEPA